MLPHPYPHFMERNDNKKFIPPRNTNDMTRLLVREIKDTRVGLYIDAANLYHASHTAKLHIDYLNMIEWFKKNCKLKKVNFYTAYDPEEPKQLEFIHDLEKAGYHVVKKPLKVFDTTKKGNMDIEIAVDALIDQNTYDVLILMSGDGDFGYLMQALDRLGKKTIVIGVGGFTSFELHNEVDNYYFFNRIREVWSNLKSRKPVKELGLEAMSDKKAMPFKSNDEILTTPKKQSKVSTKRIETNSQPNSDQIKKPSKNSQQKPSHFHKQQPQSKQSTHPKIAQLRKQKMTPRRESNMTFEEGFISLN
jgi:uncharacterized LabA/DUF88 family protein